MTGRLTICAVLAAGCLVLAGCGGGSASTIQPSGGERTMAPPPSPARTRAALRIARSSPLVHRVAGPSRLELRKSGEWNGAPDDRPLGVELLVGLRPAVRVDADLPYAEIPGDSVNTGDCRYPYALGWVREGSMGVSRLWILVDLRRGSVVGVHTNARSGEHSWVPGKPHPQCREVSG